MLFESPDQRALGVAAQNPRRDVTTMNIKNITPRFFVSGQISVTDVGIAAAQGITTIICNRPDNETPGQPLAGDVAAAASSAGIEFLHIPVVFGSMTDKDIDDFSSAYQKSKGPVLAYCGSGMRSIALWALAEVRSSDVDEILNTARNAGYDLTQLKPILLSRAVQS